MKKLMAYFSLCTMLLIFSCGKDETTENVNPGGGGGNTLDCTSVPKLFATNVLPIIQASCQGSQCHASGSGNGPGALLTHAQISSAKTAIQNAVSSGSMPKNSSLTTAQKNTIICWVNDGAKDN